MAGTFEWPSDGHKMSVMKVLDKVKPDDSPKRLPPPNQATARNHVQQLVKSLKVQGERNLRKTKSLPTLTARICTACTTFPLVSPAPGAWQEAIGLWPAGAVSPAVSWNGFLGSIALPHAEARRPTLSSLTLCQTAIGGRCSGTLSPCHSLAECWPRRCRLLVSRTMPCRMFGPRRDPLRKATAQLLEPARPSRPAKPACVACCWS